MLQRSIPFIPPDAPFTPEQRAWLNGFLAGIFSGAPENPAPAIASKATVNVYFGTESGNSESLSKRIAKEIIKKGFLSKAIGLDKIHSTDLAKESVALIVTSTFGEGDPPENAKRFHFELHESAHPRLETLKYSVLSLGDKNYEQFCKCGIDFDLRLEALGAKRLFQRVDCDVDFEAAYQGWIDGVFAALEAEKPTPALPSATPVLENKAPAEPEGYSKKNPFPAKLITNRILNAEGSGKETRHFEIDLAGSGLTYEVGDALGICPTNCSELVENLIQALQCTGDEIVPLPDEGETSLREALLRHYEITKLPIPLLKAVAEATGDATLLDLLVPNAKDALGTYLWGRELIDLLVSHPAHGLSVTEILGYLKKLQPRLYSISSSLRAFPNQVHLTIAAVRYESHGRQRRGVCSTFLADRALGAVPVFVQVSHGFRLPADGNIPIIMVGPGTGVAPFRAFLHERNVTGSKGGNWLFFGDQHAASDFYYREELTQMLEEGCLTKLSTAFSRDQPEKIYVQTRMLEEGAELWTWLKDGAHFYVCGDAKRMAKDVDQALHLIVQNHGGHTPEEAAAFVQKLKTDKRYQRDVY